MAVRKVTFRKVINSKAGFTVEAEVVADEGFGRAAAPVGTSTGKYEAVALPTYIDDVLKQAQEKAKALVKTGSQEDFDAKLRAIDGTDNFAVIGGAVAIAASMAAARAFAGEKPLHETWSDNTLVPVPMSKCIGGGAHAGSNAPEVQEFLAMPLNADNLYAAIEANAAVHAACRDLIQQKKPSAVIGKDFEGGWAASLSIEEALDILTQAADQVSDERGVRMASGIDMAAGELFKEGVYKYRETQRDQGQQLEYILGLMNTYDLYYVEDPFHDEDFDAHAELTMKSKCLVCGDDLFATNKGRLEHGAGIKACNSIIIKPNQVGTVTDTVETVKKAQELGYTPVVSHRSGETCDTFIADLAVGLGAKIMKIGIAGGERTSKLNQLIRIGQELQVV